MTLIYLYILIAICAGLLLWGVVKPNRVYQFPFFMGGIFTAFVVPQAIALVNNPYALTTGMLNRVLILSSLSAAMCWVGYQFEPKFHWSHAQPITLNENKLVQAGIVLAVAGNFFAYLIRTTASQYTGIWSGPITIYYFFANVSTIAFSVLFMMALRRSSWGLSVFTIFAVYPLLLAIFEFGRRQATATVIIIVGVILFYERSYVPSRLVILASIAGTTLLIPLVGMMRGGLWAQLFAGGIQTIGWTAGLREILQGTAHELRNAAILMEAAEQTGRYGLGTGYWDALVFQFVPGQIVGRAVKASLQLNWTAVDLEYLFNYDIHTGSTYTGIGDSFLEFGYFGVLLFAVQAYFFRRIWTRAVFGNNTIYRILYASLVSSALVGVTHGTYRLVQEVVYYAIVITLLARYTRTPGQHLLRSSRVHLGEIRGK